VAVWPLSLLVNRPLTIDGVLHKALLPVGGRLYLLQHPVPARVFKAGPPLLQELGQTLDHRERRKDLMAAHAQEVTLQLGEILRLPGPLLLLSVEVGVAQGLDDAGPKASASATCRAS
jgi:hypothetical protein